MKLIIRNAVLIDKDQSVKNDLLIEDGKIVKIGELKGTACDQVIDADGKSIMPAFIDMHAHFRTPGYEYKEDFRTGFHAALKGGFGTVCAMANTMPVMDHSTEIQNNTLHAERMNLLRYIQVAAVGLDLHDQVLSDHTSLRMHTPIFSNDGNTIFSEMFMIEALQSSAKNDFLLCTHCQPEEQIIARDLELLVQYGGNLHICHVSTKKSIEMIQAAKGSGTKLTCEVTPHHLFGYEMDYKVNPPFAQKTDVQALIENIRNKTIDVLATDHAPHSQKDKENGAPGIDNIEVAFPMYWKVFRENDLSINRLSEMISANPAKLLGLNKGLIREGFDADLTMVDLEYQSKIHPETFISKSKNNPFAGRAVLGKVIFTMIGGEMKYDCTKITE